jgi:hypothetical protein
MHVRMDDGTETDLAPGDAHFIGAGHDAWVVGDEPLIVLDIIGADTLAEVTAGTEASTASATA